MPVSLTQNRAVLTGHIEIEEAGTLHDWLRKQEGEQPPEVDVSDCTSAHTAVVQLLLLAPARIIGAQGQEDWRSLLLEGHRHSPAGDPGVPD